MAEKREWPEDGERVRHEPWKGKEGVFEDEGADLGYRVSMRRV